MSKEEEKVSCTTCGTFYEPKKIQNEADDYSNWNPRKTPKLKHDKDCGICQQCQAEAAIIGVAYKKEPHSYDKNYDVQILYSTELEGHQTEINETWNTVYGTTDRLMLKLAEHPKFKAPEEDCILYKIDFDVSEGKRGARRVSWVKDIHLYAFPYYTGSDTKRILQLAKKYKFVQFSHEVACLLARAEIKPPFYIDGRNGCEYNPGKLQGIETRKANGRMGQDESLSLAMALNATINLVFSSTNVESRRFYSFIPVVKKIIDRQDQCMVMLSMLQKYSKQRSPSFKKWVKDNKILIHGMAKKEMPIGKVLLREL